MILTVEVLSEFRMFLIRSVFTYKLTTRVSVEGLKDNFICFSYQGIVTTYPYLLRVTNNNDNYIQVYLESQFSQIFIFLTTTSRLNLE